MIRRGRADARPVTNTPSARRWLAAAAAVNLCLALMVTLGIVSNPPTLDRLLPEHPANRVRIAQAPPEAAGQVVAPATPQAPPPTAAAAPAAASSPAPKASAPAKPKTSKAPAPSAAPGTAGVRPPSTSEIEQVKREVAQRVSAPGFSPTQNQIQEFSRQVCGAFDEGYSYAQVKSAVLAMAARYPNLGVGAPDADYAIRTAVEMYCPAHKSRLP